MQNINQKQINFSLLYIILAAADFLYTIYNLIRYLLNSDFKVSQVFISLFTEFLSLLPLIAFIILSKKLEHIKDLKTCIKKKKLCIALYHCMYFSWYHLLFTFKSFGYQLSIIPFLHFLFVQMVVLYIIHN